MTAFGSDGGPARRSSGRRRRNGIDWARGWGEVLDRGSPSGRWFPGAELNTCHNALDRHADSPAADRTALIYDSAMTGAVRRFTYAELRDHVARLAGAMRSAGLSRGDRALIYMPMIPEAVMAMLACARLGVIHSVVFGGFAARELATRITQARPKLILTASCGLEPNRVVEYKPLLDGALAPDRASPGACGPSATAGTRSGTERRRRSGMGGVRAGCRARRVRSGEGDRSALHPVHLGHHRPAQGNRARQRRACRGAALVDEGAVRHIGRRRVLGGVGHRMGGWTLVHRLRAVAGRRHFRAVRREAGRHAGRRRLLAGRQPGTGSTRCLPRLRRSARSSGKIPNWPTPGSTTWARFEPCSWREKDATRTPWSGRERCSAFR